MNPIVLGTKSTKFLSHCATKIAGPENRLILGITALASQPFIDYFNSSVDKKTRKYSVCKTIAKIVIGTAVGVVVRSLAIKYSANFLKVVDISKVVPDALKSLETRKTLQSSIGDVLALAVCLVTNFLIDAPLTKLFTNFLTKKYVKEEKK